MFVVNENTLCAPFNGSGDVNPFQTNNEGVSLDVIDTLPYDPSMPTYLAPKIGIFKLSKFDTVRLVTLADSERFNHKLPDQPSSDADSNDVIGYLNSLMPSQSDLKKDITNTLSAGKAAILSDDIHLMSINQIQREALQLLANAAEYDALAAKCATELTPEVVELCRTGTQIVELGYDSFRGSSLNKTMSHHQELSNRLLLLAEKAQCCRDKAMSLMSNASKLADERISNLKMARKAGFEARLCQHIKEIELF